MEEKSICTNLLTALFLTAAMMLSLTAGLLSAGNFAVAVYVFPILYFAFYFVTNANQLPFPMYFFIAMAFVTGNSASVSGDMLPGIALAEAVIVLAVAAGSLFSSVRQHIPWKPQQGIRKQIRAKYCALRTRDPQMPLRILLHSMILFVAGFTGYLLQEYRGKWVLLACGAVLIGDELRALTRRGIYFSLGICLGCALAACIGYFQVAQTVRVWLFIPALLGVLYFMPKVARQPSCYIAGSALVAVMAMIGNSLSEEILTREIVAERLLCSLLGLCITLAACHFVGLVWGQVYEK